MAAVHGGVCVRREEWVAVFFFLIVVVAKTLNTVGLSFFQARGDARTRALTHPTQRQEGGRGVGGEAKERNKVQARP